MKNDIIEGFDYFSPENIQTRGEEPMVYISGFDIFSSDAIAIGENYKALCAKYGFFGLYPLDSDAEAEEAISQSCDDSYTREELAIKIFHSNLQKINIADYVVANLNNFRGFCVDDGTSFEIGYAFAKGKKIIGYTDDARTLIERIGARDAEGYNVEDFGRPVNIMLACAVKIIQGDFEDCLEAITNPYSEISRLFEPQTVNDL